MHRLQRGLISVAALVLSFGGLTAVAQATPAASTGSAAGTVSAASPNKGALKVNNPSNQGAVAGSAINTLQLTCSGGSPPCVWNTTGLPPGLTSNSAGQITGTPTTAGTFDVTVTARDTRNATASASFPFFIYGALRPTNPGDQTNTVGTAISPVQLRCLGGFPPCWRTVFTDLPPGLTFNTVWQVVGTPTTAGVYNVTFTVTDTRNVSASTSWKWTINAR